MIQTQSYKEVFCVDLRLAWVQHFQSVKNCLGSLNQLQFQHRVNLHWNFFERIGPRKQRNSKAVLLFLLFPGFGSFDAKFCRSLTTPTLPTFDVFLPPPTFFISIATTGVSLASTKCRTVSTFRLVSVSLVWKQRSFSSTSQTGN